MFGQRLIEWNKKLHKAIYSAIDARSADEFLRRCVETSLKGGTIYFIGNGGSAAIASHMAEDYTKNGGLRAATFNDVSLITCFANDYGYENVFVEAVKHYCGINDMLVGISSSGKSKNIILAIEQAKKTKIFTATLSSFKKDNPLRKCGDINFYVEADAYGFAEVSHHAILHALLDLHCEVK